MLHKRLNYQNFSTLCWLALLWSLVPVKASATTERPPWQHAISIMGKPLYPPDFHHFNTVNPDAPKGGKVQFSIHGSFNSLNPYLLKGTSISSLPNVFRYGFLERNESLMVGMGINAPTQEETGTLYGLIAHSVALSDNRRSLSFRLRSEARFHDNHPITASDVVFSFEVLKRYGAPHYQMLLEQVEKIEVISPHEVRYILKPPVSRTLPFRIAELPVLPKHYWQRHDFSKTTLEPPLLSGPYKIIKVKPGTSVTFERIADYWGKDLPVNRGFYNFDRVTLNFFRDRRLAFESFCTGGADAFIEPEAKNWAKGYNLPALHTGKLIKQEIPYTLPGSRRHYAFNLRKPIFQQRAVREAISMMLDWHWSNRVIFYHAYHRTDSFFPVGDFSAKGIISPEEKALLSPFSGIVPPGLFNQPFKLSETDGSGNIQPIRQQAITLLRQSGWHLRKGKLLNARGEQFHFEFLHYSKTSERFILPFVKNLASIGILVDFKAVDLSQYQRRIKQRNFDIAPLQIPLTAFPDDGLYNLFHSESANRAGSGNLGGIEHPAIDSLIETIVHTDDMDVLQNNMRALDRVLLWQHFTIPCWHSPVLRIAYWHHLKHPAMQAKEGFRFTSWWYEPPTSPINKKIVK